MDKRLLNKRSLKRIVLVALMCLTVGVGALAGSPARLIKDAQGYRMPRYNSSHMGSIGEGTWVNVLWYGDEFSYIAYDSQWGLTARYIPSDALAFGTDTAPPTAALEEAVFEAVRMMPPSRAENSEWTATIKDSPTSPGNAELLEAPGAASLGSYYPGAVVTVLEQQDDFEWFYVKIGFGTDTERYGMMRGDNLSFVCDPAGMPREQPLMTVTTEHPFVELKEYPEDRAYAIMNVPYGSTVVMVGRTGEWAHVYAAGVLGYLPLAELQPLTGDPANPDGLVSYRESYLPAYIRERGYALLNETPAEDYTDDWLRGVESYYPLSREMGKCYAYVSSAGEYTQVRASKIDTKAAFAPEEQFTFYPMETVYSITGYDPETDNYFNAANGWTCGFTDAEPARILIDQATPDELSGFYASALGENAAYRFVSFYEMVNGVDANTGGESEWTSLPMDGEELLSVDFLPYGTILEVRDVQLKCFFGNG